MSKTSLVLEGVYIMKIFFMMNLVMSINITLLKLFFVVNRLKLGPIVLTRTQLPVLGYY